MATYSTNKRLLAKYERPDGYYASFGPVGRVPTRLRVRMTLLSSYHQIGVFLTVRASVRDPKQKRYWLRRKRITRA